MVWESIDILGVKHILMEVCKVDHKLTGVGSKSSGKMNRIKTNVAACSFFQLGMPGSDFVQSLSEGNIHDLEQTVMPVP